MKRQQFGTSCEEQRVSVRDGADLPGRLPVADGEENVFLHDREANPKAIPAFERDGFERRKPREVWRVILRQSYRRDARQSVLKRGQRGPHRLLSLATVTSHRWTS